MHNDYIWT